MNQSITHSTETELITDPETGQVIESTPERKRRAKNLDRQVKDFIVFTALLIKEMRDKKYWLDLDEGFQSFNDYCRVRFEFGERMSQKYALVGSAVDELCKQNEKRSVLRLIDEKPVSELLSNDSTGSLRKTFQFFQELGIEKSYQLCSLDGVILDAITHGGVPVLPDGKKLTIEQIKKSKNLKKDFGPKEIPVNSGIKQIVKPADPQKDLIEKLEHANRHLQLLNQALSNLKTDSKTYQQNKKRFNEFTYQIEQTAKYAKDHSNLIEDHREPVITDDMYPLKQVADAIGITARALRKMAKKIPPAHFKATSGPSGKEYYINPESLPEKHRNAWKAFQSKSQPSREELNALALKNATEFQREEANKKLNVVKKISGLSGKKIDDYIYHHNSLKDNEDFQLAKSTVYKWRKSYRQKGIAGLMPKWGKNNGATKVRDEDLDVFASYYMNQNKVALTEAHKNTLAKAVNEGSAFCDEEDDQYYMIDENGEILDSFPCATTFLRALEAKKGKLTIEYAREGEYRMRQTGKLYTVDRDHTMAGVGDYWFSDHRQTDVLVSADQAELYRAAKKLLHDTGIQDYEEEHLQQYIQNYLEASIRGSKPVRLWLTAWIDMKSLRWLCTYLHADAPNSDHVMQSFKWSVMNAGGVPKGVYLDNGMDFKCLDFAGKPMKHKLNLNEPEIEGLLDLMDVGVKFAIPKNARAKTIERQFRPFIEGLEKLYPTYTGKNASERPESTKEHIKKGNIVSAEKFIQHYKKMTVILNNTAIKGKEHAGLSPNQLWQKEPPVLRKPTEQALQLLTLRSMPAKKLKGNGYYDPDFKRHYFDMEALNYVDERVFGRRDPHNPWEAHFYLAKNGKYIFTGELQEGVQGIANTPEEKQKLAERLEIARYQRGTLNASVRDIKSINPEEALENIQQLQQVSGQFLEMTGTDNGLHLMEDNKLNRMAHSIAEFKSEKQEKQEITESLFSGPITRGRTRDDNLDELKGPWDDLPNPLPTKNNDEN